MTREITPIHAPRKRIRLDAELYARPDLVCSITMAIRDRARVFDTPRLAECAVAILREHARVRAVTVYAYCVMPDHIHLLIAPSDQCNIVAFVGQVKNLIQREAWALGVKGAFWQKRFWDHFLRDDEDVESVVRYIVMNPVRAGLAAEWQEYPYSGSLDWELREW